jgi:hypothetical protein
LAIASRSPEHRPEWLAVFQLRFSFEVANMVEAVENCVDWMLDPERAVLIEGGDAFLGGTNLGLALSVVAFTKSTIARLGGRRSIGQRVGDRGCLSEREGKEWREQDCKRSECREQHGD